MNQRLVSLFGKKGGRSVRERLEFYFRSAIIIAFFAVVIYYAAGFTLRASVTLATCFCIAVLWIGVLVKVADFKPYKLIIDVNFPVILADLGLLRSVEDWKTLRSRTGDQNTSRNINQFVVFTAITPRLFARSDDRRFSTGLWISEYIEEVEIPWQPGPGSSLGSNPRFFFCPAIGGYQFGVQVDSAWWETDGSRKTLAPALRDLKPDSAGNLVLGKLPYGYFPDHIQQGWEPVHFFSALFSTWERRQRAWVKTLTALGWTVNDDCPDRIEHRYIGVGQYEL